MIKKIGIIGRGKTGSYVSQICSEKKIPHLVFSRERKLCANDIDSLCGIIIFAPYSVFLEYEELLIGSKLPIVLGATGPEFDLKEKERLHLKLTESSIVYAANFSILLNLLSPLFLGVPKLLAPIKNEVQLSLTETHQVHKLDAPSGTAHWWQKLLAPLHVVMTSVRIGEVVGEHQLKISLKSGAEEFTLSHSAKSRRLFAEGALYALEHYPNPIQKQGLIPFSEVLNEQN